MGLCAVALKISPEGRLGRKSGAKWGPKWDPLFAPQNNWDPPGGPKSTKKPQFLRGFLGTPSGPGARHEKNMLLWGVPKRSLLGPHFEGHFGVLFGGPFFSIFAFIFVIINKIFFFDNTIFYELRSFCILLPFDCKFFLGHPFAFIL